jgi:hypothetical protein
MRLHSNQPPTTNHQQPTKDEFFARLKHLSGLIRIVVKTSGSTQFDQGRSLCVLATRMFEILAELCFPKTKVPEKAKPIGSPEPCRTPAKPEHTPSRLRLFCCQRTFRTFSRPKATTTAIRDCRRGEAKQTPPQIVSIGLIQKLLRLATAALIVSSLQFKAP